MNCQNSLRAFLSDPKLIGFLTCKPSPVYSTCRIRTRKSKPNLLSRHLIDQLLYATLVSFLLLGMFIVIICLSGCGGGRVTEAARNTSSIDLNELNALFEPPNRRAVSPATEGFFLNSLISEFGDIPQVRTYVTLMQKHGNREPLSINEVIALLTANLYLYPSEAKAEVVKTLEAEKAKMEAAGIDFPTTYDYSIWIDITDGDSIEAHYPDGSKKVSGVWREKLPRTIRSIHQVEIDTQQDSTTPEAETANSNTN